MSEIANSEGTSESEKPVHNDSLQPFPPFPAPKDEDFDDDIPEDERAYYLDLFKDLNTVKKKKLHCSACDRHLGCSARKGNKMRAHPMLRTLVCQNCHVFYNSGEFVKGDDGSELYCRWCGQGGQVYCCSDCPHVFCAKCIKRNLGVAKIKEIETADDWKCFKCNTRCLWDLRAVCWAVLRYCDIKNKLAYQTQDMDLRESYKKDCLIDYSECCKSKSKKNQKPDITKKKEIKKEVDPKLTANIISKIPSTIQVKKFASVNVVEEIKSEKKPVKRSHSPKMKPIIMKHAINIASCPKILPPVGIPPLAKKIRLPNPTIMQGPVRFLNPADKKTFNTYSRARPKTPMLPVAIANSSFNGFNSNMYNNVSNDNINLSLESLTQGLDMAAVAALNQNAQDDDVVCTPDFPMEPLCEVTEDNDDDVECITPGPVVVPKIVNPPPLVPRGASNTTDLSSDNIIQMTENDVSVNANTGGLKFRVDPQTLSSNKMYRLPDGRIFAINANPNMPGGYSATIVAVTESSGKQVPKSVTYAAKLSSISTSTPIQKANKNEQQRQLKRNLRKDPKINQSNEAPRVCNMNVPVEWYRYNLVDAVDSVEYALTKLKKLKEEANTVYLRTRNVNEMRNLHRTLERLLSTTSRRFDEIRDTLNKGMKEYISRKNSSNISDDEDDDDVEILPDVETDPIFIDENSMESNINVSENQEVDLTGAGSSEYNDSGENIKDKNDLEQGPENDGENSENEVTSDLSNIHSSINVTNAEKKISTKNKTDNSFKDNGAVHSAVEKISEFNVKEISTNKHEKDDVELCADDIGKAEAASNLKVSDIKNEKQAKSVTMDGKADNNIVKDKNKNMKDKIENHSENNSKISENIKCEKNGELNGEEGGIEKTDKEPCPMVVEKDCTPQKDLNDKADDENTEISEEMIASLLNDDSVPDETTSDVNSMDVSEVLQEN